MDMPVALALDPVQRLMLATALAGLARDLRRDAENAPQDIAQACRERSHQVAQLALGIRLADSIYVVI